MIWVNDPHQYGVSRLGLPEGAVVINFLQYGHEPLMLECARVTGPEKYLPQWFSLDGPTCPSDGWDRNGCVWDFALSPNEEHLIDQLKVLECGQLLGADNSALTQMVKTLEAELQSRAREDKLWAR